MDRMQVLQSFPKLLQPVVVTVGLQPHGLDSLDCFW